MCVTTKSSKIYITKNEFIIISSHKKKLVMAGNRWHSTKLVGA